MKDHVILHDKAFKPMIENARIEAAIDQVAARLNADYKDCAEPPVLLCVLTGSIVFMGELMKRLDFPLEVVSIKLSSYSGTRTTGIVRTQMGLTGDIEDRDVIIVEDIVDTGHTLHMLKDLMHETGARSVKVCTLLLKPDCFKGGFDLEYVAMEIPNDFIVGFGLDYDELGRNLPDIYVLDPDYPVA